MLYLSDCLDLQCNNYLLNTYKHTPSQQRFLMANIKHHELQYMQRQHPDLRRQTIDLEMMYCNPRTSKLLSHTSSASIMMCSFLLIKTLSSIWVPLVCWYTTHTWHLTEGQFTLIDKPRTRSENHNRKRNFYILEEGAKHIGNDDCYCL